MLRAGNTKLVKDSRDFHAMRLGVNTVRRFLPIKPVASD